MGTFKDFSLDSGNKNKYEYLRIEVLKRKRTVSASLRVIKFTDKDTKQIIVYVPSLDISGYGATAQKAHEMVKESTNQYYEYLTSLNPLERERELIKHGWEHRKFMNKQYSKSYVDLSGELQELNAENGVFEETVMTV